MGTESSRKSEAGRQGLAEVTGDTDVDLLVQAHGRPPGSTGPNGKPGTILIADLVGTPAFHERLGDEAVLNLIRQQRVLVAPVVEAAAGKLLGTVGDASLAVFSSPADAAQAAVEIQRRVELHNRDCPEEECFFVRAALESEDMPGKPGEGDAAGRAAKLVKACKPGQVLLADAVHRTLKKHKSLLTNRIDANELPLTESVGAVHELGWTPAKEPPPGGDDTGKRNSGTRKKLGRYEILGELGAGGMGVVYKAHDPTVGRTVAVKTVRLDVHGPEREEMARRLRQEAQAAGRLEHPAIVTVYDAGEADGVFYVAMQFVEGKTLSATFAERILLPVTQILALMEEVCDGLQYAHERNIVHRDLKPSNIVIGAGAHPKILDFGIAKITDTGTTKVGTVVGTPNYMSPEQAAGRRIDGRSDIFSLGSILYELLTGERAFAGNAATAVLFKIREEHPVAVRKIDPTIDPALERVVEKALRKDPFERYQSCREMKEDLEAVRRGREAVAQGGDKPRPGGAIGATVVMNPAELQAEGVPTPTTPPSEEAAAGPPPPPGTGLSPSPATPSPVVRPAAPATSRAARPVRSTAPRRQSSEPFRAVLAALLLAASLFLAGLEFGWVKVVGLSPPSEVLDVSSLFASWFTQDSAPDTNASDGPSQEAMRTATAGTGTGEASEGNGGQAPAFPSGAHDGSAVTGEAPAGNAAQTASGPGTPSGGGQPRPEPPKPKAKRKPAPPPKPRLTEQQRARIDALLDQARRLINLDRLALAEQRVRDALGIDGTNSEAKELLKEIQDRKEVPKS